MSTNPERKTGSGIAEMLAQAVERGASDLHLSAGSPPLLRVDGEIAPLGETALASSSIRR